MKSAVLQSLIARGEIVPDRPEGAQAHHLLIERSLHQLNTTLSNAGLSAALVKGTGLLDLYEPHWIRQMADIDLLVDASNLTDTCHALVQSGFEFLHDESTRSRDRLLGETAFRCPGRLMVAEIHTSLDKVGRRPVDHAGILARSHPHPDYPALVVPSYEDQFLLVVQHLAVCEFRHPWGLVDLELLIRAGVDLHVVTERAQRWGLSMALYLAMQTLAALGFTPEHRVAKPDALRLATLRPWYRLGRYPLTRTPYRLGLPWVLRQFPLRDSYRTWLKDVVRFGLSRR